MWLKQGISLDDSNFDMENCSSLVDLKLLLKRILDSYSKKLLCKFCNISFVLQLLLKRILDSYWSKLLCNFWGGVPLLNFEGGPGVPLLNFEGGPGIPFLNFRTLEGSWVPLLNFEGGPRVPRSQISGSSSHFYIMSFWNWL